MAYGKSESVSGIIRFRWVFRGKEAAHHVDDLFFCGMAIPDDGFFDLQRRVFVHGDTAFFAREDDRSPAVRDRNGCFQVRVEKEFLDSDCVGFESRDELRDVVFYLRQPERKAAPRRRRYDAMPYMSGVAAGFADNTESDCRDPGVNSKYYHLHIIRETISVWQEAIVQAPKSVETFTVTVSS